MPALAVDPAETLDSARFEQGPSAQGPSAQVARLVAVTAEAPGDRAPRCVYQPSRRSTPAAMVGAGLMVALVAGAIVVANAVVPTQERERRLAVVTLNQLDATPPPPPRAAPQPAMQAPPITAPKSAIELPVPAPMPVAVDVPAPIQPVVLSPAPAPVVASVVAAPAGPSSTSVEGGDLSSKMISATPPAYPVESRRQHEQGTVKLLVLVGTDGRVQGVDVASSSGSYRLDRAALSAVRRWRWSPTTRDGVPVQVRGYVVIPFVLQG